jgi:type I restriction enzyme S subunit
LGSGLKARKEKVDRTRLTFSDLQPITIHFDGTVDRRKVVPDREYTMELFAAKPGDVVVAKIDLKNGALGIVPEGWANVVVTGHFAVYEPDRSRLLPEYLHLLIQTELFKAHLWRNKVGAEGRKEVKLDFFEAQLVPFPPLPVQREIVATWESAQKAAAETAAKIAQLERDIETGFLGELGVTASGPTTTPRCFAVPWRDFLRWSVSYNQTARVGKDLSRSLYPLASIGSTAAMIQYGTSEKANTAGDGMPVVRMNNITNGELDLQNLKHVRLKAREATRLLLVDGDILFNRTNSKELVGKCGVFHEKGHYVFASYLIRVRLDAMRADPDFVAYVVNCPIGRQQIDALSRQIIGQANVNSGELRSLRMPLPPLPVQREIVERVAKRRDEIARLKSDAKARADAAKADVEAMILGSKKVVTG